MKNKKTDIRDSLRTKFGDKQNGTQEASSGKLAGSGDKLKSKCGGVFNAVTDTATIY